MRNISFALLITLLQSAVSLTAQLTLARILSPDIFGQFATCSVLVTILMALSNLQCDKYIISSTDQTLEERFKTSAYIEFLVSIFFFSLAVFFLPLMLKLLNKEELIYYSIVMACCVIYTPLTRSKSILDSQLNFFKARVPQLIAQSVSSVIAIVLALKGYGLSALIIWRLCAYTLEILVLALLHGAPKFKSCSIRDGAKVLGFVRPLYGAALIFTIYGSFDYYVLSIFISNKELGLYWLSFQLTNYLLILKTALNNILLPYYSQVDECKFKTRLLDSHTKLIALIYFSVSVICMMLSDVIISFILGEEWLDMAPILNVFTVIVMIKAYSSSFLPYLITIKRRSAELNSTIFSLSVLAIMLPILLLTIGIFGALFSVLVSALSSYVYLYVRYIYSIEDISLNTFLLMILMACLVLMISFLSIELRIVVLFFAFFSIFFMAVKYIRKIKFILHEFSSIKNDK